MREILFRGKVKDSEEWVCGSLLVYPDGDCAICVPIFSRNTLDRYFVDPDTVGQYTGVEDKFVEPIFEGYIVRVTDHYSSPPRTFTGTVEYKDCSFVVCESTDAETHYSWMGYEVEVISNKWDRRRNEKMDPC